MPYGETKVYYDGSHYIAIPHTEVRYRKRCKLPESVVAVPLSDKKSIQEAGKPKSENEATPAGKTVKMTRKQLFDQLYTAHVDLPKKERQRVIKDGMQPYFPGEEETEDYVGLNMERKQRNLTARRIRLMRKVNLQDFNYFVTFTYDDAIHTEVTFKKRLRNTLSHLCARKGWKYIGVWERSPKKKRLHFHGIFHVPEGTLPGIMTNVAGYSFSERKRQVIQQNDYFRSLFGRNDFKPILDKESIGEAVAYILKYIEKSGEKIVYSRGLPQYFISDVMDEDVVCPCGQEDKKLLLFDDFVCWDEGCYVGTVSKSTIRRMRKSN